MCCMTYTIILIIVYVKTSAIIATDRRRLVYAQQHACRKVLRETTGSALTLLRNTYKYA